MVAFPLRICSTLPESIHYLSRGSSRPNNRSVREGGPCSSTFEQIEHVHILGGAIADDKVQRDAEHAGDMGTPQCRCTANRPATLAADTAKGHPDNLKRRVTARLSAAHGRAAAIMQELTLAIEECLDEVDGSHGFFFHLHHPDRERFEREGWPTEQS